MLSKQNSGKYLSANLHDIFVYIERAVQRCASVLYMYVSSGAVIIIENEFHVFFNR